MRWGHPRLIEHRCKPGSLEAGHGRINRDVLGHHGWRVVNEKTVASATVADGIDRSVIRAGGIDQTWVVDMTLRLDLGPAIVFNATVCSGHSEAGKERQDRIEYGGQSILKIRS